jgi:hypothetical protein
MNEVLVELVADYALLLERMDEAFSPDDAVRLLEDIAAGLQKLSAADRVAFIKCLERVAARRSPGERDDLLQLPEAVGIA